MKTLHRDWQSYRGQADGRPPTSWGPWAANVLRSSCSSLAGVPALSMSPISLSISAQLHKQGAWDVGANRAALDDEPAALDAAKDQIAPDLRWQHTGALAERADDVDHSSIARGKGPVPSRLPEARGRRRHWPWRDDTRVADESLQSVEPSL